MRKYCKSCGDPLAELSEATIERYKKLPDVLVRLGTHCTECAAELGCGEVRNQNVNFFGGSRYGPLEDNGPWQDNAIRDMEG